MSSLIPRFTSMRIAVPARDPSFFADSSSSPSSINLVFSSWDQHMSCPPLGCYCTSLNHFFCFMPPSYQWLIFNPASIDIFSLFLFCIEASHSLLLQDLFIWQFQGMTPDHHPTNNNQFLFVYAPCLSETPSTAFQASSSFHRNSLPKWRLTATRNRRIFYTSCRGGLPRSLFSVKTSGPRTQFSFIAPSPTSMASHNVHFFPRVLFISLFHFERLSSPLFSQPWSSVCDFPLWKLLQLWFDVLSLLSLRWFNSCDPLPTLQCSLTRNISLIEIMRNVRILTNAFIKFTPIMGYYCSPIFCLFFFFPFFLIKCCPIHWSLAVFIYSPFSLPTFSLWMLPQR